MIKNKDKTQKELDMEGSIYMNMIQTCSNWFGDSMKFATNDEIYNCIYTNYVAIEDYQQRRQYLKTSTFRLLCGNASLKGQSQAVINQLHKIKP